MTREIARFEMPTHVELDDAVSTDTYGRFYAEPFEAGYGRTVGNSLRRVLLSSIEGAAITSVKIDGAIHEFCALPGVVEDVTDIILNLKKVRLRMFDRNPRVIRMNCKGKGVVTAADFEVDEAIDVANPECHIATLDVDGHLILEAVVRIGRGYVPGITERKTHTIGTIPVDALFSPVVRVNFSVDAARVGQRINYDRLVLEVWTDGQINPKEAVAQASVIMAHHFMPFMRLGEDLVMIEQAIKDRNREEQDYLDVLNQHLNQFEFSVRTCNVFNSANIQYVWDLVQISEADILRYRNFGKKSLNEVKAFIEHLNETKELPQPLRLGMTLPDELKDKLAQTI
ncbi:MAG: DNA-directed RNA polymerase subunit alpha [Spartobacteria bacterium]|nr:DNA-directed RNA polymerase subunit alpha [Spartobacteria bacterium]